MHSSNNSVRDSCFIWSIFQYQNSTFLLCFVFFCIRLWLTILLGMMDNIMFHSYYRTDLRTFWKNGGTDLFFCSFSEQEFFVGFGFVFGGWVFLFVVGVFFCLFVLVSWGLFGVFCVYGFFFVFLLDLSGSFFGMGVVGFFL